MAKVTLSDLVNLNNPASTVATINANNAALEAAMEKTLSRDGTSPNSMGSQLDMNSNRIINLPSPIYPTDPVRLSDLTDLPNYVANGYVSVVDYGATGGGIVEDTVAIQACIDANKGRTIYFPPGDYLVGSVANGPVVMDGSSYNYTHIVFHPNARLIQGIQPIRTQYNFYAGVDTDVGDSGAAWAAWVIRSTTSVKLTNFRVNGQRTVQPVHEYCHGLILMGNLYLDIDSPFFEEVRGDGMYITQKNLNLNSTNSQFYTIRNVRGYNSEYDGRNLISIIGLEDFNIDTVNSQGVGGILNYIKSDSCSFSIASPTVVTTSNSPHGLIAGDQIIFETSGALPSPIATGTIYYVLATDLTVDTFKFSLTPGGTAVNALAAGSGIFEWHRVRVCTVSTANPAVFTRTAHGLTEGTPISMSSLGTVPTGLRHYKTNAVYYVITAGLTANTFQVSLTKEGTPIATTDSGTGTVFYYDGIIQVIEPGGVDVEPNASYQSVKRGTMSNFTINHGGAAGLAFIGRPGGTETTRDITFSNMVLTCAAPALTKDQNLNYTLNTGTGNLRVIWASGIVGNNIICRNTTSYGNGPWLSASQDIFIDGLKIYKSYAGMYLGGLSYDASEGGLVNFDVRFHMEDVARFGVYTGYVTDGRLTGSIATPQSTMYTNRFGIVFAGGLEGHIQTNVNYSVSFKPDVNWTVSYRAAPGEIPTFVDTSIRDCDMGPMSGWLSSVAQAGDVQIPKYNMLGVTNRDSIPTSGGWFKGTLVTNNLPIIGTPSANKILYGWYRATTGSANVAGTDWHLMVIANT